MEIEWAQRVLGQRCKEQSNQRIACVFFDNFNVGDLIKGGTSVLYKLIRAQKEWSMEIEWAQAVLDQRCKD